MATKIFVNLRKTYSEPQDHGFMFAHGFHDLDGHIWEVFWMNPSHVQQS
jgi:uncharacterized protein